MASKKNPSSLVVDPSQLLAAANVVAQVLFAAVAAVHVQLLCLLAFRLRDVDHIVWAEVSLREAPSIRCPAWASAAVAWTQYSDVMLCQVLAAALNLALGHRSCLVGVAS